MFGLIRYFRRKKLAKEPFPNDWFKILEARVPFFSLIPNDQKGRFLLFLRIFSEEKHFIGASGMEITDEVKVVISACAVRLVLYLDISFYDRLTEIVVYPYVYHHPDDEIAILGEAHEWGTVVLSWPAVLEDLANSYDGHETAFHEFAHFLDRFGDGRFDGTPKLRSRVSYRPWAQVMSRHYFALRKRKKEERKVLRMYGATNEAEFFAVCTEAYFEKPRQMKKLLPDLYEELQEFYGGDPASLPYPTQVHSEKKLKK